jgi:hypothetical protein
VPAPQLPRSMYPSRREVTQADRVYINPVDGGQHAT